MHNNANPVFWKRSEKRNKSKCRLLSFFFDCATRTCNYNFCKHSMKNCGGESYYHTNLIVSLANPRSAASHIIGTRILHVAHLYCGADRPVSGIISLYSGIKLCASLLSDTNLGEIFTRPPILKSNMLSEKVLSLYEIAE